MNHRLRALLGFVDHYKYLIVMVLGVIVVGFLDENSFRKRIQYQMQISDMKKEIKRYNDQNAEDLRQLRELERDPTAIEKIARERYYMKADDEDIYVLSDDENITSQNNEAAK